MKTNREIRSRNENYINKGLTTFPKTIVTKQNALQEELSKLKCNQDNYHSIVTRCFEEIKAALYKEFPPLSKVSN